jgi:hypothetical protein
MGKRKTNEEFLREVYERNEYVRRGEIEILGDYIGIGEPIQCRCNIHDTIWYPIAGNIRNGSRCRRCADESNAIRRRTPVDDVIQQLNKLKPNIKLVGKYVNMKTPTEFECEFGHIWPAVPYDVIHVSGCPYCSGRKVMIGVNDLWTTRPDVAKLLKDPSVGYRYTSGSNVKTDFVCDDCGYIMNKSITDICHDGFSCKRCSDYISYPNKFSREVLTQLNVDYIDYEYQPDWLKPYFYDNYFEVGSRQFILEMDGGLGHGRRSYGKKGTDIVGKNNDILKDDLAKQHGVYVIRVDCDYHNKGERFEYIKCNLLNSELSSIFDLSKVNWQICHENALSSLVVKCAHLYNDGHSIYDITKKLGYHRDTIRRWLKQADLAGLCLYDKEENRKRGRYALARKVNQYTKDGNFVATHLSVMDASRCTGIAGSNITGCCRYYDGYESAGGFLWFYAEDTNQPDKTKIILTIQN